MKSSRYPIIRPEELQKPSRLARVFGMSLDELKDVMRHLPQYYRERDEPKKDKLGYLIFKNGQQQVRHICESIGTLKRIQKLLHRCVLSHLPLYPHVTGGVKKWNNVANAALHRGKKYKLVTDLRNFFPSIGPDEVYMMLISHGFSADVSHYITRLVTFRYQLPQGAPTSTTVANLVFGPIDRRLAGLSAKYQVTLSRFVDDLVFSRGTCFKDLVPNLLDCIRAGRFTVHNRKTLYKPGPRVITGVETRNNVLRARDDQYERLRNGSLTQPQRQGLGRYVGDIRSKNQPKRRHPRTTT